MTARCPICKKSVERAYAPFCSKRCADVDLQRWFTGRYAIPGSSQDLSEDGETTRRDLPRDGEDDD